MEQTGWKVPVQGERWINDMKKRLFVLMLAGLMTFGSSACVFAAETETEVTTEASSEAIPEITMDMMDADLYEGTWVSFAGGFDLYIPSDWDVLEISEEDQEKGMMFQAKDPSDSGLNMVVTATEIGTDYDLSKVKAELEEAGNTDVELGIVNSIPAVSFTTESTYGIAFLDDAGIMYNVQIGPKDIENAEAYVTNIVCSPSVTETAESETEAVTE